MGLDKKDFHHGAALVQMIEHPSFTSLNKACSEYGHYLVNEDRRVFMHYASNPRSPWKFQFTPTAIRAIEADEGVEGQTYIALICGDSGVCLLDTSELWELLSSIPEDDEPQSVAVISPPRKQFEVRAGAISLGTKVPRTRFPREVLEH